MKPKIKAVCLFNNGMCCVADEQGQQIAELQYSFIDLWATRAASLGYNPEGVLFETELGNLRIRKMENGWGIQPA